MRTPVSVGACPRPPYRRNPLTGRWERVASRCRSRRCVSCGWLWAMDTRVKLLRNAVMTPFVGMVTVTAPGVAGGLVWDDEWCAWRGRHRHSGREGCRVRRDIAASWNEAAPEHWRELHRRALQAASRYAQRVGCPSWGVLARMWEFQRRGVLHVHVVLPMTTAAERRVSRVYAGQVAQTRERLLHGTLPAARANGAHDAPATPTVRLRAGQQVCVVKSHTWRLRRVGS